jgi:hypothetical protein
MRRDELDRHLEARVAALQERLAARANGLVSMIGSIGSASEAAAHRGS